MKPRSGGLPKNPTWQSIDVNWGGAAFAGRWVKTWPAPEGWEVTDATVQAIPGGGAVAAAQLSRGEGAEAAVAVVRWRANGRVLWSKLIDPAGEEDAYLAGLAATRDAVVVGATKASDDGSCWLVRKYRADGSRGWTRSGDADGHSDVLGGVTVTADGSVFAGGGQSGAVVGRGYRVDSDWCVRKYSAAGKQQWQRLLASEDAGWTEEITAVARFRGGVVVAGTWAGHGQPFGCSISVARLSADGTVRWRSDLAPEGLTAPRPNGLAVRESGIAVGGRDSIEASGAVGLPATGGRCAYRLDPGTGTTDWQYAALPAAAGEMTGFSDVAIDDHGIVTAAGDAINTETASELGIVTWFDDAGDEVSRTVGGDETRASVAAVAAGTNGVSYLAATLSPEGGNAAMTTICCQPGGVVRWITYTDIPECVAYDIAVRGVKVLTAGGSADGLVLGQYDTTTAPLLTVRPD
jgi:hypothetical protein